MKEQLEQITQKLKQSVFTKTFLVLLLVLWIVLLSGWIYSKLTLRDRGCSSMNDMYRDFPKLHSMNPDQSTYQQPLRDYYIKTAYNACSMGNYKNDFVDVCALKNCIKQGARGLDMAVYSLDDEPVIATSSVDDYTIKETYNSLPFQQVVETIRDFAFSGNTCPNSNDPLILHLRIMTNNRNAYTKIANSISTTLEHRILGPNYSYENHGKNLGNEPVSSFMGKVILIVDKSNPLFEDTPLDEYVNLASHSIFMRNVRFSAGIKYAPDIDELVEYNKKQMTICLPDIASHTQNFSPAFALNVGCQMVGLAFQQFDEHMEYYDTFFDEAGTAFVLKPEHLRYVPVVIAEPSKPPEKYSYKERQVKEDYYQFTI
jgi:hypothetical protein